MSRSMTRQPVGQLALYCLLTAGIYYYVWLLRLKDELNEAHQAGIPSAWDLIVPIYGLIWFWRLGGGVSKAAGGSQLLHTVLAMSPIGGLFIQDRINKAPAALAAPSASAPPT